MRNARIIDDQTLSAEEWPPESVEEGGVNAHLMPADIHEQHAQGGSFASVFRWGSGDGGIQHGDYFDLQFTGNFVQGGFCEALFVHKLVPGSPEAEAFCGKNGPATRQNKRGSKYKMTEIDQKRVDRSHLGVYNYHSSYKRTDDETGAADEVERREEVDEWGDMCVDLDDDKNSCD
ncbi:hypothetical protein F4818DRAFT_444663 [Hypoxylon cercidicola]|nr:hypothetical protein F4818DRAFT_444663 [Hypoxylon cercidicola]